MFGHLMGNDPKPHYAHQSNLIMIGDRRWASSTSGHGRSGGEPGVLDALFARYNTYFSVPLAQPTLRRVRAAPPKKAHLGRPCRRRARLGGYLQDGKVHVVNTQALEVPLTGVNVGDLYGGQRAPAGPRSARATPSSPRPTRQRGAADRSSGSSDRRTRSTPSPAVARCVGPRSLYTAGYQWQRCNGNLCANITGVVDANYKTGAIDSGFSIRVVEMAGNWVSSVSQAASEPDPDARPPAAPGRRLLRPPPRRGTSPAVVTRLTLTRLTSRPAGSRRRSS